MPAKQQTTKTYKTANGKPIDLDMLIARNELVPAVSNVKVNARGDELGAGGKIVRRREDVLKDYYNQSRRMAEEVVPVLPDSIESEWEEDIITGDFVKPEPKVSRRKTTQPSTQEKNDE